MVLKEQQYFLLLFLDSSMVEHTAVNRGVVGSSPTRGVPIKSLLISLCFLNMRFTLVAFFFSKSRVAK